LPRRHSHPFGKRTSECCLGLIPYRLAYCRGCNPYEPAKIFNDLQKDLGARISTFINHLLVLDAGILSITISAFLGIQPPRFVSALGPNRATTLQHWSRSSVGRAGAVEASRFGRKLPFARQVSNLGESVEPIDTQPHRTCNLTHASGSFAQ